MRIAVVGAGRFGRNHVRTLHEMGCLWAIADPVVSVRTETAEKYGIPTYVSHEELICDRPDAVVIATPVPYHYSIAKDFLNAGIPCLVEKPLTLDVSEAEDLVQIATKGKVVLMVGHLLIYQPAIQWIRSAIMAGMIGRLKSLHQERLNLGVARANENALWSLGVHDISVALFLVGTQPTKVSFDGQVVTTPGVEDDTYVHLEFDGDVRAHIHNSWLWPEKRRRLVVVGDRGMLIFDEVSGQVLLCRKRIDESLNNVDEGTELVFEGANYPLRLELEHFVECVRGGLTPQSDGQQGVETLRVLASTKR